MRIKKINEIICLGNKITKGYGNEINNSSSKYDMNAKIVFEPWKEYEISQTNFEKLSKVFWFESNFLKMNRKIGFELSCSQKIKMENDLKLSFENYLNNRNNSKQRDKFSVIEMLLQNNSIKINTENKNKTIIFETKQKYYLNINDIDFLSSVSTSFCNIGQHCLNQFFFGFFELG